MVLRKKIQARAHYLPARIIRKSKIVKIKFVRKHPGKEGQIVVPDHSSREIGIGLKNKILKDDGLK